MGKAGKYIVAFALLWGMFPAAGAEWKLVGDTAELKSPVVFSPVSDNANRFEYVGPMVEDLFKVTDGTTQYIQECGSNNPLGDSIPLREADPDERGMSIRYAGKTDVYRLTLTVDGEEKSLKAERIELPKNLYIIGGPFNREIQFWKFQDAKQLVPDTQYPYIFYYKGVMRYNDEGDECGSFMFIPHLTWDDKYHPALTGDCPIADKIGQPLDMRLNGEDNKWSIASDRSGDGYYEIKVDLLHMTMTVEKFEPDLIEDPFPLSVFAAGAAMPCGWDNSHPMVLDPIADGVYRWQGEVQGGDFKFLRRRGTWERCYVATTRDEPVHPGEEHDVVYEYNSFVEGNDYKFTVAATDPCIITLDLNRMKMRVDTEETIGGSGIAPVEELGGLIWYAWNHTLSLHTTTAVALQTHIFALDGRLVAQRNFVGSTDITLARGCYVVVLRDEKGLNYANLKVLVR